ncbi:Phosphatidylglycerophosphatase A [Marininema mesophilum]|uniref:Phosphatidylglycerophosphatase A n=1 Tax=Marininema mesophilum TaxID=1048340 RepID=A0A1H2XW97_9BACL|nr:phosphatidylglycerophosphatase A [Marininema mesophilum]SDW97101.1 Phosphatidylglycerophosphatase A [Marininema mesophilum]
MNHDCPKSGWIPLLYDHTLRLLAQRGVTLMDIAEIAYELQRPYNEHLKKDQCLTSVEQVLKKREIQHAIITGIALDVLAEEKRLPNPLQLMMEIDEPLYGLDEILALSITNVYGTIGLTSFGYLDKIKIGILRDLNNRTGNVHVFLDDLVAGVAAAASARIAHENPDMERYREEEIDLIDKKEEGA